jgi:hypothetical protein
METFLDVWTMELLQRGSDKWDACSGSMMDPTTISQTTLRGEIYSGDTMNELHNVDRTWIGCQFRIQWRW